MRKIIFTAPNTGINLKYEKGDKFMRKAAYYMIFILCFMLSGCSGTSGNISEGQDAHLLSVNVEVIEKIGDGNATFRVQALESCSNDIENGDVILVTAEIPEICDILEAYQESNSFRIYFPKVNEAADGIGVVCFDIVQYDSNGQIIRCIEMEE